jgi:hypothetical protein
MKAIMEIIVDGIDVVIERYRQSNEPLTEDESVDLDKLCRCSKIIREPEK